MTFRLEADERGNYVVNVRTAQRYRLTLAEGWRYDAMLQAGMDADTALSFLIGAKVARAAVIAGRAKTRYSERMMDWEGR